VKDLVHTYLIYLLHFWYFVLQNLKIFLGDEVDLAKIFKNIFFCKFYYVLFSIGGSLISLSLRVGGLWWFVVYFCYHFSVNFTLVPHMYILHLY